MKMRPWRLTHKGVSFTDDDLLACDLVAAQVYVNDGWNSTNVWESPLHCLSVTAIVYARLTIDDCPDAKARAGHLRAVEAELRALPVTEMPLPEPRQIEHTPAAAEVHDPAG